MAGRGTDHGGSRIGGAGGSGAWVECQPGISVVARVPPMFAESAERGGGELVSGSCDGRVAAGSGVTP
jgi:hypothetical protein